MSYLAEGAVLTIRNRARVWAAVIVVLLVAAIYAVLLTWHYIEGLKADNKILFEAVVEQDEIIHRKYFSCEKLLADPVVKRIMSAGKRRAKHD